MRQQGRLQRRGLGAASLRRRKGRWGQMTTRACGTGLSGAGSGWCARRSRGAVVNADVAWLGRGGRRVGGDGDEVGGDLAKVAGPLDHALVPLRREQCGNNH